MKPPPLVIWLHARLSGTGINSNWAMQLFLEQTAAMKLSGLLDHAEKFIISCSDLDYGLAKEFAPGSPEFFIFEANKRGELPTVAALQKWVQTNTEEKYIFYNHLKCATRSDDLCLAWRRCMLFHCVEHWIACRSYLDAGKDAVGVHFMVPEEYAPGLVKETYFGGNIWWARSSFLATLPEIADHAANRAQFFSAESWIGWGPRRPRVYDFHHGWPNEITCKQSVSAANSQPQYST